MQNLPPQLTPQAHSPMGGMPQGAGMNPMEGQMMENNENMPNMEEQPQKILAHFQPDELLYLDEMQGGALIDPETNLREYTPLNELLKDPKVRDSISANISQEMQSQERQQFSMGGEVEPGRPNDPELEKLRLEGRNDDTELAIITPDLLNIFSEWNGGEPNINPKTGLPEFGGGLFKSVVRIVAPVVGAVFGGPLGAAAASGIATKATGGSWRQALGSAAMSGFGAMAAPMVGGAFQSAFPGASAALGQGTRAIFGNNIGGALGNLFTPSQGGGVMSSFGLGSVGRMIPGGIEGQMLQQAGASALPQAAGTIGGGILSSLGGMGNMLPLIGSGLMMAKGHGEEQKGIREHQAKLEAQEARQKQENEAMRERMGFNRKLGSTNAFDFKPASPRLTKEEIERGVEPQHFGYNLAEQLRAGGGSVRGDGIGQLRSGGGAIRGDGKGQEDNIPKNIKENSYIIDASSVSDIGDGSTDAGFKELDRYFSRIPSQNNNSGRMHNEAKGGYIKAMVSDGEYEISPEKVTALGHGSNEKGAQILKKFIKEVRAKKRTSGEKLPPKSKPIGGYLNRMQHTAA